VGDAWVEVDKLKSELASFFAEQGSEFSAFGKTVNQTFEAFVFAQVVSWYKARGWTTQITKVFDKETKKKSSS